VTAGTGAAVGDGVTGAAVGDGVTGAAVGDGVGTGVTAVKQKEHEAGHASLIVRLLKV
jgi:hypothetical protein